jgi:glutamine synthetase
MSAHTFVLEQWSKRLFVAVSVLLVGLIAGLLAITLPRAASLSSAVVIEDQASILRGIDADAARYTALAASYAARSDGLQHGIDASAARYTALAASYGARSDARQRGIDASAARYTALATHFATRNDGLQRGIDASAARYTAMAAYYAAKEE